MSKYIKKYGLFLASLLIILGFGIFQANSAVRSVGSETGSATATETKSCWQQGYRMISCPDGNCQTCTDSSNGKNYFRKGTCNTTGYINSCPAGSGQIPDPLTKLSCNSEYSLTCVCDTSVYKYGEGRTPCEQSSLGGGTCTIGGKTFYKTCECPAQYSKTCEIGVELPVDANDSCGGKYQACKCITQVVAVGQTCTQKVVNGTTCYVDCRAETIKTCETEGYVTSCPAGFVGGSILANDGKLSCRRNCIPSSCEAVGYVNSCPSGQTGTNVPMLCPAGIDFYCLDFTCKKDCKSSAPLTCEDIGYASYGNPNAGAPHYFEAGSPYIGMGCFKLRSCDEEIYRLGAAPVSDTMSGLWNKNGIFYLKGNVFANSPIIEGGTFYSASELSSCVKEGYVGGSVLTGNIKASGRVNFYSSVRTNLTITGLDNNIDNMDLTFMSSYNIVDVTLNTGKSYYDPTLYTYFSPPGEGAKNCISYTCLGSSNRKCNVNMVAGGKYAVLDWVDKTPSYNNSLCTPQDGYCHMSNSCL